MLQKNNDIEKNVFISKSTKYLKKKTFFINEKTDFEPFETNVNVKFVIFNEFRKHKKILFAIFFKVIRIFELSIFKLFLKNFVLSWYVSLHKT